MSTHAVDSAMLPCPLGLQGHPELPFQGSRESLDQGIHTISFSSPTGLTLHSKLHPSHQCKEVSKSF